MLSYLNEKPETDESSKAMQAQCELDKAMAQEEDHRLERATPTACIKGSKRLPSELGSGGSRFVPGTGHFGHQRR